MTQNKQIKYIRTTQPLQKKEDGKGKMVDIRKNRMLHTQETTCVTSNDGYLFC
jgi:hypothetical protein